MLLREDRWDHFQPPSGVRNLLKDHLSIRTIFFANLQLDDNERDHNGNSVSFLLSLSLSHLLSLEIKMKSVFLLLRRNFAGILRCFCCSEIVENNSIPIKSSESSSSFFLSLSFSFFLSFSFSFFLLMKLQKSFSQPRFRFWTDLIYY